MVSARAITVNLRRLGFTSEQSALGGGSSLNYLPLRLLARHILPPVSFHYHLSSQSHFC